MADFQQQFNDKMMEIAADAMHTIGDAVEDSSGWESATIEARFSKEGAAFLWKFRALLSDGTLKSLRISDNVSLLLEDLWELRQESLLHPWYGIKFTITPDNQCRTDFNFDPECFNDPNFIDDYFE